MNFQTRILVAVALCALIFTFFEMIKPPPEPVPDEEIAAQEPDTKDGKEGDEADPSVEAGDDGAPQVVAEATGPTVEVEEHELRNELLSLTITNKSPGRGGLISAVHLLSEQFEDHTTATDSLNLGARRTLEVSLSDEDGNLLVPRGAAYEVLPEVKEDGGRTVALRHVTGQVEIEEQIELLDGYEAVMTVKVKNLGEDTLSPRLHVRSRIGISDSRYDIRRGLCRTHEDVEYEDNSDVEDEPIRYGGGIEWSGVDGKYFATLIVPTEAAEDCEISLTDDEEAVEGRLSTRADEIGPGATKTYTFGLYIGPKELERLKAFAAVDVDGVELEEAIDWGFFGGLSKWLGKLLLGLMRWFYGLVHDWGWSIVLLTVVVKASTLPLTLKQMSSMKRMKEVQPQLAKIKEKYKDDRMKQAQEQQELFRREGVNPLAGCLPMVVQLPIWFALYSMLGAAVELVHEPFLWLPDLTEQDPYYVLPIALGALMILQQQMMPSTMDAAQAKMMRWIMPIMFTVFMLFLPSGLGVYIFANIVLSLIQTAIQVGTKKNAEAPAGA